MKLRCPTCGGEDLRVVEDVTATYPIADALEPAADGVVVLEVDASDRTISEDSDNARLLCLGPKCPSGVFPLPENVEVEWT